MEATTENPNWTPEHQLKVASAVGIILDLTESVVTDSIAKDVRIQELEGQLKEAAAANITLTKVASAPAVAPLIEESAVREMLQKLVDTNIVSAAQHEKVASSIIAAPNQIFPFVSQVFGRLTNMLSADADGDSHPRDAKVASGGKQDPDGWDSVDTEVPALTTI